MQIQLVPAASEHAPSIGRIFYHAFKDIMGQHGLEPDVPSEDVGITVMESRISSMETYGVVALADGQVAGGNFYTAFDSVASVGPLIVDPARQGLGLGRRLMEYVVTHAKAAGFERIQLLQDSINMVSLTLYTKIGFSVTEPVVLLKTDRPAEPVEGVRPLTMDDIQACGRISAHFYGLSRENEVAHFIRHGSERGIIPVGLERKGQLCGYAVPGFSGHGFAPDNTALMALITTGAALSSHPATQKWLCPARNGDLFNQAMRHGYRAVRALQAMAIGPWQTPAGSWYCSIEG